jgi:hypothetical protein
MKRLFFILWVFGVGLYAHAQIPPLQTTEKPYEFISSDKLYRTVADDSYHLQIKSDNQYEDKVISINLGIGAVEAMKSLSNLFAIYGQEDSDFKLQGYSFGIRGGNSGYIFAYQTGVLAYTAGNYIMYEQELASIMFDLLKAKSFPLGDVHVTYYNSTSVFIYYNTYGFRDMTPFYHTSIPWSHEYMQGEIISNDDLRLLMDVAKNPNAYRSPSSRKGALVPNDDQIISVCNAILTQQ